MQPRTKEIIKAAYDVLEQYHPMTLRQVYYQLVSKQIIENNQSKYQSLSNMLVEARQENIIPWEWIEDRVRQPQGVPMWSDLNDFLHTVRYAYRRNVWEDQPSYVEVWLEKDALSGIFSDITEEYGVTLVVGRGYNSWSAYKKAVDRFIKMNKPVSILYFGDFDPSGEDIVRALKDSLHSLQVDPDVEKIAIILEDIKEYNLPPNPTKKTDKRTAKFVKKNGDISVELDALPLPVLQGRIKTSIENHLDRIAFEETIEKQEADQKQLLGLIDQNKKNEHKK